MATRTPDARAKGLLSWLILAVAVVMAAFTVAILVAAVQVDGVRQVSGAIAAGGLATLVAVVAFVDQRRKVRATRTAELSAEPAEPVAPARDASTDDGSAAGPADAVSR